MIGILNIDVILVTFGVSGNAATIEGYLSCHGNIKISDHTHSFMMLLAIAVLKMRILLKIVRVRIRYPFDGSYLENDIIIDFS